MANATMTKPKPSANNANNEGWEKVSSGLPPFCILQPGGKATGLFDRREVREEERKVKGKLVKDIRIFYRLSLTQESQGMNGGKKSGILVTYPVGTVVTVPGAGALDKSMDLVAWKLAGKNPELLKDEMPTPEDYELLKGREFRITRLDDSEMKSGSYKGKPVKVYDVEHRVIPT